ncbi:MAG: hypothetical protein JSU94_08155 [Phycisphaerales bacterium]|nr:MAG: hypothetical protein JSU94_08155 [Phycisphaerales bacterium]
MSTRRSTFIIVSGIVLAFFAAEALGCSVTIKSHSSRGHFIGAHKGCGGCSRVAVRRPVVHHSHLRSVRITSPFRRRLVPILPQPPIIVARPPAVRPIVVDPLLGVTVAAPRVVVHKPNVIVWIRNSNGSRTSVRLTRSGTGYLGPRGEWYRSMPTGSRLRVVYGF